MHITTNIWCEAALENYEVARDNGLYTLCEDIIADVKDKGYTDLAEKMEQDLKNQPITKFLIESPYAAA